MPSTPSQAGVTSGSSSSQSLHGFAVRMLATVFVAELAVMLVPDANATPSIGRNLILISFGAT